MAFGQFWASLDTAQRCLVASYLLLCIRRSRQEKEGNGVGDGVWLQTDATVNQDVYLNYSSHSPPCITFASSSSICLSL